MKLVCPKCRLTLKIPSEKIPPRGAWAVCPKCRERFYIRPEGQFSLANQGAAPQAAGPIKSPAGPGTRSPESQRLLDRLTRPGGGAATDKRATDFDLWAITVYPQLYTNYPRLKQIASWFFLSLPVLFLVISFQILGRQKTPPPPPPSKAIERMQDNKNQDLIRYDLMTMKRELMRRKRVTVLKIHRSGPEARIFNYFRETLVPGICPNGVSGLEISSLEPTKGFQAVGICIDSETERLRMNVSWPGRTARVDFSGFPAQGRAEMDLYPQLSQRPPAEPEAS